LAGNFCQPYMDNLDAILFAGNARSAVSLCSMSPFAKLLETAQPADLGSSSRPDVSSEDELNGRLVKEFRNTKLPAVNQQLIRALILLWHDHLDVAHTLAQNVDTTDGAYVHAIMHRREPDYGNAAYWFRRVGRHAVFPELARRVSELLKLKRNDPLQDRLVPKAEWDPFAFVEICKQAASGSVPTGDQTLLREIQRVEFEVLLDYLVRTLSSVPIL